MFAKTGAMNLLYGLSILMLSHSTIAMAQSATVWNGIYDGTIKHTPVTLTLKGQGNAVSGQVNAEGYLYNLTCTADGNRCAGTFSDPQTQGSLPMVMAINKGTVELTLIATDTNTGAQESTVLTFLKGRGSAKGASAGTGPSTHAGNLDMRLVGEWLYTDTYFNGDSNKTTQLKLIMKVDGTFKHGDAKLDDGALGFVQSGGGNYITGRWKTENAIIYLDEGQGWQPYCKYFVDGKSFMMTFDNRKRQWWNRH